MTWSIEPTSTPDLSMAPLDAAAPRSIADTSLKDPPKEPNGVRAPPTTNTSLVSISCASFLRGAQPLELRYHKITHLGRRQAAPGIERWQPSRDEELLDRLLDQVCRCLLTKVLQH